MKTFEKCCDKVAKKYGFGNWEEILTMLKDEPTQLTQIEKEATKLYASECVKEAVKLAREYLESTPEIERVVLKEILEKLKL